MKKKHKVRSGKKFRRRLALAGPVAIVLLLGLAWFILSLPLWSIKEVVVNGAIMLSPEEVRGLAAVPLSENLFFTRFDRARHNLGRISAIESFRLHRLPPGTVLINLTERRPIATVVLPDRSLVIDAQGYVINRNPNLKLNIANQADLPVVSGLAAGALRDEEQLDLGSAQLITGVISWLSPYLAGKRLQLELGGLENVSILLDDLLRIKVGDARRISRKMEVLGALLRVVAGRWGEVEYIDVRYPDNPVIYYR